MPSTGSGACTLPGIAGYAGKLTTGAGGTLASFACFNAPSGTANIITDGNYLRGTMTINPAGTVTAVVTLGTTYRFPPRAVYCATAAIGGLCYIGGDGQNNRGLSYNGNILSVIDSAKVRMEAVHIRCSRMTQACPLHPDPLVQQLHVHCGARSYALAQRRRPPYWEHWQRSHIWFPDTYPHICKHSDGCLLRLRGHNDLVRV